MTTKEEVKKLLGKGLTGKEAGKLVLQDNWLVDHGKAGFLSEKDVNTIKYSLKSTQYIQDYNSYIETYRILDYTMRQADIARLEAEKMILALDQYLLMAVNKVMSEHTDSILRPTIMTEKQYQEVKAIQRDKFMKAVHTMAEIILWRLEEKDPGYLKEEEEDYISEPDLEYLVEEEPDRLREAVLEIIQLLKTGQIQPVTFSEKYVKKLKDLEAERQPIYEATHIDLEDTDQDWIKGRILTQEEHDRLSSLDQEEDLLKSEAYKTGRRDQEKLISTLEGLIDGSIKVEKAEAILKSFYTTGEELYKAGLPEHVSWIDDFKTSFFGGDGTLGGIAIIQNPHPSVLDDRGYYIESQTEDQRPLRASDMAETYTIGHKHTIEHIKLFLAFHSIVEGVSEVIGIDFAEDTRAWLDGLSEAIDRHNKIIKESRHYALSEIIGYEIKPIKLDRYKPSARTVKYLRDRMAISLGEGWNEAKEALVADIEEKEAMDD